MKNHKKDKKEKKELKENQQNDEIFLDVNSDDNLDEIVKEIEEKVCETNIEEAKVKQEEKTKTEEKKVEEAKEDAKEDLEEKCKTYYNNWLRAVADFDNYRKRVQKDKENAAYLVKERIMLDILRVIDNFERALESVDETTDIKVFYRGVEMIYRQLNDILVQENVEVMNSLGEEFNPNLHEALLHIHNNDYEENKICQVIQKGYMMDNRLLRAAKVAVSKGKEK